MLIDLQVHSTYSDGYLTPTEMAKFLAQQGVRVASLTDHNTVGGIDEFKAACARYKIKPIVGLELYVKLRHKRLSLLWYNFDHTHPELHRLLRTTQTKRRNKARKVLESLRTNGFKIKTDKILDKYNHYIAINHLIDDLWSVPANRKKIKKELATAKPREEEIIHQYFLNNLPVRFDNSYINISRLARLKKRIGGQLVFNHPAKYNQLNRPVLEELKKIGVDGLEVLSPHHSIGAVFYAQFMAKRIGFVMTGGSDFHRLEMTSLKLKDSWQYFKIDSRLLPGVEKIIG